MKHSTLMLAFLLVSLGLTAQTKPSYELSEVQKLRLQVKLKDAQLAQIRYLGAVQDFNNEAKAIEKENGWPDTLILNADTLTFQDPPAPPKPPNEPDGSKAPAKK